MHNYSYANYLASPHWTQLRQKAVRYYRYRCAVCGTDWRSRGRRLDVHHYSYRRNGQLIFNRERLSDLCCLCEWHHPKGSLSKAQLRAWRRHYLLKKLLRWLAWLPFRLLWQACRR